MVDRAAGGQHHARRGVVRGNVVHEVAAGERAHVLRGTQDGAAQRAELERCRVQVVKHHLLCHALHLSRQRQMHRATFNTQLHTYR